MLNKIDIMGRLTKDPELRYTSNETPVCSFTVACDRDMKKDGKAETDFINCVAWRTTGEFINKYFAKGRMIVLSGRLEIRSYTDKNGDKRTAAEVNVSSAYFADSKKDQGEEHVPVKPQIIDLEDDDDDLPF